MLFSVPNDTSLDPINIFNKKTHRKYNSMFKTQLL